MLKSSEKLIIESGLSAVPDGGFLQSIHWEKFQQAVGRKVVRVENEAASALMIEHELPLVGSYFFVPRGPIVDLRFSIDGLGLFFEKIIKEAKSRNDGWVRVEPQSQKDLENIKAALKGKFNIAKSKKNHEPVETLMLDLNRPEDEILSQMKQKTRYNIRLARKKGVEVFQGRKPEEVEKFCSLIEETAKRDGITPHPDQYYQKMIEMIDQEHLVLYLAKYEGKEIASNLISFFGGAATYLHGASSNDHRNVMAPYLLQWEAIKDAKARGMDKYDFGGTNIGQKNGSWHGITRFKVGFCPSSKPVKFPGCYDIIINVRKYNYYLMLQKIKSYIR